MPAKSRNLWIGIGVAVAVIAGVLLMRPGGEQDPAELSADAAPETGGPEPSGGMPAGHPA